MIVLFACILLAVFALPAIILGIYVAPWFFLFFLGLMFIPLLFIGSGAGES